MLKLCLRSFDLGLLLTLALIGGPACSGQSLLAGDGGHKTAGPDGSATEIDATDPAACGCQVDGSTLTISWDCYCKHYDCTTPAPSFPICPADGDALTHGCGFQQRELLTVGGQEKWVYTDTGVLIGVQLGSDTADFACPTDPSLRGYMLRAGKFPLDTCEAQIPCPCTDAGLICPTPDAGTGALPPIDAAI